MKNACWTREKIEGIYPNLQGDPEGLRRLYMQEATVRADSMEARVAIDSTLPEVKGRNRPHVNVFIFVEAINQATNVWVAQFHSDRFPLRHESHQQRQKTRQEVIVLPTPPAFYEVELQMKLTRRLRPLPVQLLGLDGELHRTDALVGEALSEIYWNGALAHEEEAEFILAKKAPLYVPGPVCICDK
jgi:hypothetical protein